VIVSLGEAAHVPGGCHWGGRPHLGPCRDRSREAGNALSEVRTVLSRAITARGELVRRSAAGEFPPLERPRGPKQRHGREGWMDAGPPPAVPGGAPFDDPDHALMVAALDVAIAALSPWRRGPGATRNWVMDDGPAQLLVAGPPEAYEAEVGDEMFMGQQAVLGELRGRLAAHFGYDADTARTVLGVVDEYMRELVDKQREDEDDAGGHECHGHDDAAECDEFCNPHWCVRPGGQGDVPVPDEESAE
jgi:hypothetical protein